MIRRDDVYKIGKLGKPHGVKGEITFAITDDVFDRVDADYLVLDIDGILVPFYLEEYRFKNDDNVLVKFEDIDTQEQVRAYTGCEVYFPRHLSDSDEENMSWAEIIGFQLVDAVSGRVVGTIDHVDDSTLNLLFEITSPEGEALLIPANNDLIEEVDIEKKMIRMAIPEGLLEL
nr:ribosome maturation factor RimM [uncultured Prevotella sp.]